MSWNTNPTTNPSANRLISSYVRGFVEVSNNVYANAGMTTNGNLTITGDIYANTVSIGNTTSIPNPNQLTLNIDARYEPTSVSKIIPYQNGTYINANDITMELDGNLNNGNTTITFGAK